jgi:hypothetical protein
MKAAVVVEGPRLPHALPGRMRVHLAGWPPEGQCAVETRLCHLPGVLNVQANSLTGNAMCQSRWTRNGRGAMRDFWTIMQLERKKEFLL